MASKGSKFMSGQSLNCAGDPWHLKAPSKWKKPVRLLSRCYNIAKRCTGMILKASKVSKNVSQDDSDDPESGKDGSTTSTNSTLDGKQTTRSGARRYVNGIPRSILHDPDVDTSDLDGR
jgi:hypothetical protein